VFLQIQMDLYKLWNWLWDSKS